MLFDIVYSQDGGAGKGEERGDHQTASPATLWPWDDVCCDSQNSVTEGERDEMRVLVIESEPIVSLLLRLVLENRGYSVREVGSRAEAASENGKWEPDVIVTEFPMTDAASVEFVVQVRANAGARGVLIIGTGPNMPEVPGIDAPFARPFEAEEVARKVGSLIGEAPDGPAYRCVSLPAALDARGEVLCDICVA